MGVVLAHAGAAGKRLSGAGLYRCATGLVDHALIERVHQFDQRRAIATFTALLAGERAQGLIGLGQAGEAQKR
ncbi:hypothetical protein D3C77_626410 [compost metagenome]